MIKILIFDLGGVIIDDLNFVYSTYKIILKDYNKEPQSREEFDKIFTANWIKLYHDIGIYEDVNVLVEKFKRYSLDENNLKNIKLYPDTKECLLKLKKKYKIALLTSYRRTEVDKILKINQIEQDFFCSIITGENINKIKPRPDGILEIIKENNVKANECVMIGDTISDIEAGKNAQSKTIAVTWGTNSKEDLIKADPNFIVDSWKELYDIIIKLEK